MSEQRVPCALFCVFIMHNLLFIFAVSSCASIGKIVMRTNILFVSVCDLWIL